jgi:hypothetical protein
MYDSEVAGTPPRFPGKESTDLLQPFVVKDGGIVDFDKLDFHTAEVWLSKRGLAHHAAKVAGIGWSKIVGLNDAALHARGVASPDERTEMLVALKDIDGLRVFQRERCKPWTLSTLPRIKRKSDSLSGSLESVTKIAKISAMCKPQRYREAGDSSVGFLLNLGATYIHLLYHLFSVLTRRDFNWIVGCF